MHVLLLSSFLLRFTHFLKRAFDIEFTGIKLVQVALSLRHVDIAPLLADKPNLSNAEGISRAVSKQALWTLQAGC